MDNTTQIVEQTRTESRIRSSEPKVPRGNSKKQKSETVREVSTTKTEETE